MRHILCYDVVGDYVERRTQFREAHLKLAREAHGRGELVLAGALADPVDGAVLLFRGDSSEAAEASPRVDLYVTNGLVKHGGYGSGRQSSEMTVSDHLKT